ncbi:MAG TPA: T6SS immunity protein Tdi1 domain-containing protein [Burkholderiaceae bacterium]|jgi:hypothetical protein|nr:T6SS immunity protein Tdi1 domain-containing protein [Burkholderiaceae bacterium]
MSIVAVIKESWGWTGIDPVEVVRENEFGNLIIRDIAGKYWRLCPEDVYCKVIANNQHELDEFYRHEEFLLDWNMTKLTELALGRYGELAPNRKFHLAIPGVLGGKYDLSNIRPVSFEDQIRFAGDIAMQINDLPDGSQIKLNVIE